MDNTFLDLHYFSDSTQPYTRIALMLNLASIILITVLQSLKKSVIWINSDFLVTQEWKGPLSTSRAIYRRQRSCGSTKLHYKPCSSRTSCYRWFLTTYASLWLHNTSDSLSFRCLSHVNTTLGHSTQKERQETEEETDTFLECEQNSSKLYPN